MGKEESWRLDRWEKGQDGFPTSQRQSYSAGPPFTNLAPLREPEQGEPAGKLRLDHYETEHCPLLVRRESATRRLSVPFSSCNSRELAVWVVPEKRGNTVLSSYRKVCGLRSQCNWESTSNIFSSTTFQQSENMTRYCRGDVDQSEERRKAATAARKPAWAAQSPVWANFSCSEEKLVSSSSPG